MYTTPTRTEWYTVSMNPKNGKKVLIVEDDNLLLVTLTHQFEEAGYEVVQARDGEAGMRSYDESHPDAVIMDVMMPKKDGLAMLEGIRAEHPDDHTPFIILTNAGDMDYVARATEIGTAAYLVKSDRQIDSVVGIVNEKLGL